jgi:hypothetical protein
MKRSSMSLLAAGLAAGLTALAAGQAANCAKAPTLSVGITPFACQSTWGNQLTQSNATTGSATIFKIGYFRFTPDTTARYFFGVCGASADSKMALGAACPTGATVKWTVLGYNDDSCLLAPPSTLNYASRLNPTNTGLPLTATLNAGQTYYIGVGGYGSANVVSGNLSVEIEPPPFNPCAAPVNGGVGDTLVTTDTLGTGPSLSLSGFCSVGTDDTLYKVHYVKFTAPYNGDFIANSCLQASDMRMAVLTECGNAATTIACNDNHSTEGAACPTSASAVQFSATAGSVYYIAFGLGTSTALMPTQVVINIRDASVPLPTPCDPEFVMEGVVGVQQVLKPTQWWWPNLNLTGICNPGPFGDDLIYKPKYIRFTALANGTITVSNCTDTGANVDARIAAMTECGVAATAFVCDDDACTAGAAPYTSKIEFEGVAGTTYYFAVGGFSAATPGPYNVTIVAPEAPGIPEDLNGDGLVDAADLAILLGAWGTPGPGDFNGDGVVDAGDLANMLAAWTV